MLAQKGYIKTKLGMYATLSQLYKNAFFVDGEAPAEDFLGAFTAICDKSGGRRATFERQAIRRNIHQTAPGLTGLLNQNANRFFKQKSLLAVYREADYVPDRRPSTSPISAVYPSVKSNLCHHRFQDWKLVTQGKPYGCTGKSIGSHG